jgi:hypothetical protein
MPVKRIDMALHIQELCAEHGITVRYQSLSDSNPRYYARPSDRLIQIRPTKNTGYYVSALHELGHILGRFQSWEKSRLTRELWAWVWARQNALVWTETAGHQHRKTDGLNYSLLTIVNNRLICKHHEGENYDQNKHKPVYRTRHP